MSALALSPVLVGRYAIFDRIAAGGMAVVHLARLVGQGGFARTVAVKRLHPQFALDPEFVAMFQDEARLAARIRHPNVIPTLDIVAADGELFLVMEYVEGESLATLLRTARTRGERMPIDVAAGIMVQVLQGLHAAHEAKNDYGEPLGLVHRDVSPQNVIVGTDGVARVLDFGVAKALGKLHTTREGQLKGKLGYLAPEQVLGHPVTRRSDVFAAAVVLWEMLAGKRLFSAESEGEVLHRIMDGVVESVSRYAADVSPSLDAALARALAKEPADRFDTALVMAEALEQATAIASARAIGQWMRGLVRESLDARARLLGAIESATVTAANPAVPVVPPIAADSDNGVASRLPGVAATTSVASMAATDEAAGHQKARGTAWGGLVLTMFLVAVGAAALGETQGRSARVVTPAATALAAGATTFARPVPTPDEKSTSTSTPTSIPTATSGAASAPPSSPGAGGPMRVARPHTPAAPRPKSTGLYTRE